MGQRGRRPGQREGWHGEASEGQEDDFCKYFRARWGGLSMYTCVCVFVCVHVHVCVYVSSRRVPGCGSNHCSLVL